MSLPKNLAETYVRIFEEIPEVDRPIIRRAFLWMSGHSRAPWLVGRGINVNLLLSAVAYDFSGTEFGSRAGTYDCDYLKELCGCLVTLRSDDSDVIDEEESEPSPLGEGTGTKHGIQAVQPEISVNGTDLFVSLAHYTVLEFLTSTYILQTGVSSLALSSKLVWPEFVASVLRQAVAANPAGTSADWATDREAYCLTVGCALYSDDDFSDNPEIQDLFIQYLNPTRRHYPRFKAIQTRIWENPSKDESFCFFITKLPIQVLEISTLSQPDGYAATLLNIVLIKPGFLVWNTSPPLLERFLAGNNLEELLSTKLCATYIGGEETEVEMVVAEGTIREMVVVAEGTIREMLYWRCPLLARGEALL
jgi:hypothetical protein